MVRNGSSYLALTAVTQEIKTCRYTWIVS